MTLDFVIPELHIGNAGTPPFQFYRRGFNLGGSGSEPTWKDIILHGVTALTLVNSKANGLNYLKLFGGTELLPETYIDSVTLEGKCEQNGTPTPTVPVDIVCNNGAIKYSLNMANVNEQTALIGYFISNAGVVTADPNNWIYQNFIPVKPNTTYTLTMSAPVYFVTITEYSTADDSGFVVRKASGSGARTQFTITTETNTNFVRFGTNINRSEVTLEAVLAINWMLNVGNSMAYQPYVEGGIYTDGATETVTDSLGNVATAQMLLSVDNYKDTQEVLTGAVTRNVGIKVLDGTENFTALSTPNCFRFGFQNRGIEGVNPICSHYPEATITLSVANMPDKTIKGHATAVNSFYLKDSRFDTADELKAWLVDQYNAGTPVIIVYALETATTETVSGQFLSKSPVTYSGSITGLTGTVIESQHTTPTPTQPLPINCNNGVVKINEQGQVYTDGTVETVKITGKNLIDVTDFSIPNNSLSSTLWTGSMTGPLRLSVDKSQVTSVDTPGTKFLILVVNGIKTYVNYNDTDSVAINGTLTSIKCYNSLAFARVVGKISLQLERGTTTTAYEPYFNGGTATAERLLKVGDYQDVQSVLDGKVTRNIGIKILDGTENDYAKRSDYAINYTGLTDRARGANIYGMCSHFVCGANNASTAPVGSLFFNVSNTYLHFFTEYGGDVTSFKSWLTAQYQAGTPVIVVYPLAEPTTETVTHQHLGIQAGTNVVEITQASIDNLELEVSYKGKEGE